MPPPGERYTRRVCAVLLADVSGYSALMGEDDERTVQAVDELRALVRGIVAEAGGQVDPRAGDAFFATFENVVAAVDAALQIQRRTGTEKFAGRRLRIRIGVHYGDLLLHEGSAHGDAINVAARLEALARPGTICISDGVYRHVRRRFDERFEDLGLRRLKNISDPVHAYLIVPRDLEEAPARRGRGARLPRAAGAMALAALIVAAVFAWRHYTRPVPGPAVKLPVPAAPAKQQPDEAVKQVTLGVMLFKPLGDDPGTTWMREALRDGLNTQLSELSQVKVYSKEFIDFLTTREGLTEIEVATKLGITKMLSGSFVSMGNTLRIETHVVDVASGVLESSVTTTGRTQNFLELQSAMVMDVIAGLDLPVTEEERQMLLARRSTDLEALRLLLEAEGGADPGGPPKRGSALSPRSSIGRLFGPSPALADQPPEAVKAAVLNLLERYRQATEQRDMATLAGLYADLSADQQAAQQRYFDNVRGLKIALDDIDVAVVGDEAVASYTRTDDFTDTRTGRAMHVTVRLTKVLRRENGVWKLAGSK